MISRTEIQDAGRRIAMHIRRTPVMALEENAFGIDARIFFKLECLQHTGSFKPRGAFNCILNSNIGQAGVIAASGGNHGAAVAYVAHKLDHRAEFLFRSSLPKIKLTDCGSTALPSPLPETAIRKLLPPAVSVLRRPAQW